MPNRLKQFILLPIIGMALAATPILAFKGNKNVSSSSLDEGGVFISESTPYDGCVFYPASYSSNITGEPNYSTQNGYTFSCMNYVTAPKVVRGETVKVATQGSVSLKYNQSKGSTVRCKFLNGKISKLSFSTTASTSKAKKSI